MVPINNGFFTFIFPVKYTEKIEQAFKGEVPKPYQFFLGPPV
jgi:hypothetical protein